LVISFCLNVKYVKCMNDGIQGLISFREANLLYQPGVGSATNKQRIATVLAHELAHMWFGNLVTMKWWDDLWLNEGFASYMEYKGVAAVHPDWDMESQFVSDDFTRVLQLDGQKSSHPIVQSVYHPDQITEIFDTISYSKGASVIRMLESFIGAKNFQKGVSKFLKEFSFSHAKTGDLFTALQPYAESVNISFIMDTWTRQMGFPVLNLQFDKNSLTVTQERFSEDKNFVKLDSLYEYKWAVPMQVQKLWANDSNSSEVKWFPFQEDQGMHVSQYTHKC